MNSKKERAATNGPNQFRNQEHDKLTIRLDTAPAAERSTEKGLHEAFLWILDELAPIRRDYRDATSVNGKSFVAMSVMFRPTF